MFSKIAAAPLFVATASAGYVDAQHGVQVKSFSMTGYKCAGTETLVYYPTTEGSFPVAIYGHGSSGGVDGREAQLKSVASQGFVVVAPKTGGYDGENGDCNGRTEWHDLDRVLKYGQRHVAKLVGTDKADWTRLGLWGYSMGGKAATMAAYHTKAQLRALVASHGARHSERITSPSLYLTARGDSSTSPPQVMRQEFDSNQAGSKVFINLNHGGHTQPIDENSMVPWVGRFLTCHVAGNQDACSVIYGTDASSLCQSADFDECLALSDSPDHLVEGSKICVKNSAWFLMHFELQNLRSKNWVAKTGNYGRGVEDCMDLGERAGATENDSFQAEVAAVGGMKRQLEFSVRYRPNAGVIHFECKGGTLGFECKFVPGEESADVVV